MPSLTVRSGSGGETCRISRVLLLSTTQVAVVYSVLSVAVVLGLGDAARRLARAVHSPSTDEGSELLATLTEREREILKLFAGGAVLPGDWRDTEQQRPHRAQRRVGGPE